MVDYESVQISTDSAGNRAQQISFTITVISPSLLIPDWIKDVAAF